MIDPPQEAPVVRAQRADGSVIPGVYAVGESSSRAAAGVGYNSGYSLSRAMAFGWLAVPVVLGAAFTFAARKQVRDKEAQIAGTPDGTMTRDHAKVRPQIKKGFEAMPIPKE